MKRTRLKHLYLKNKTDTSRIAYIKQRDYCVSLLRKTKKDHYVSLDEKDFAGKQFWGTVKVKPSEKQTLVEVEEIINEDWENAEILNNFFSVPNRNFASGLRNFKPIESQIGLVNKNIRFYVKPLGITYSFMVFKKD